MPVLPLVASITVCPGRSVPRRSASSMMPRARRSFTEPIGLKASSRSEEHTSELQSLMRISYAVFCLKKKNTTKPHKTNKKNNDMIRDINQLLTTADKTQLHDITL